MIRPFPYQWCSYEDFEYCLNMQVKSLKSIKPIYIKHKNGVKKGYFSLGKEKVPSSNLGIGSLLFFIFKYGKCRFFPKGIL